MSQYPDYSGIEIEILDHHEAVRRRTRMYIGATDQRGLHAMFPLVARSLLVHYRLLGQPLNKLTICLEQDGSATLTAEGSATSAPFWGLSAEKLERELLRGYFFIVNALCERLHMTLRGPEKQWRSLLFERGMLRSDELHSCPPDESSDMWLRLWPDFSILETGAFDYQQTLEVIRPFSEKNPSVAITISGDRSH